MLDKFRSGEKAGTPKMPVKFKTKVERKTATQNLMFDVDVKGYFIGKKGKPDFFVEEVTVTGIPNMDLRSFFPKEVDEIKKYAIRVEYPRLLGIKVPE